MNPWIRDQVMYYHEDKDGQFLEEGINEAGAFVLGLQRQLRIVPMIYR